MSLDYIDIGSSPCDEKCAQVGSENYYENAMMELKAYKHQIIRMHGEPPFGARLRIKGFPHDFGTYHELIVEFDENNEEACNYAYKIDSDPPANWDEQAKLELERQLYTF